MLLGGYCRATTNEKTDTQDLVLSTAGDISSFLFVVLPFCLPFIIRPWWAHFRLYAFARKCSTALLPPYPTHALHCLKYSAATASSRKPCQIATTGAFCLNSEVERAILILSLNYQDLQVLKLLESNKVSCRLIVALFSQWLSKGIRESLKVSPGRGGRPLEEETEALDVCWCRTGTHPSDSQSKFPSAPLSVDWVCTLGH